MKKEKDNYDRFIKEALAAGFTDDQINFLEEWLWVDDFEEPS